MKYASRVQILDEAMCISICSNLVRKGKRQPFVFLIVSMRRYSSNVVWIHLWICMSLWGTAFGEYVWSSTIYVGIHIAMGMTLLLLLLGLSWFLRWLRWYYVGCYPLVKCWWKIKVVEKNEDVVRFCIMVLMAAWSKGVYAVFFFVFFRFLCLMAYQLALRWYAASLVGRKEGRKLL